MGFERRFWDPTLANREKLDYLCPVSKQRPSDPAVQPVAPAGPEPAAESWRRRVFKNTFTRNGERRVLSKWSVKIQHRGVRRTFSLGSTDRDEAAAEAQAIYQTILVSGWPKAVRLVKNFISDGKSRPAAPAAGPRPRFAWRDWIPRLVRGRYASPRDDYSVRIEHDGAGHFFPLSASDATAAARLAMQIHRTASQWGWEQTFAQFPREVTIALHWATEPLAWTYSTFLTVVPPRSKPEVVVSDNSIGRGPTASDPTPVAGTVTIVENDHGVFEGLAGLLKSSGLTARRCHDAQEALARLRPQDPQLILINHSLPDRTGEECAEQLACLSPATARIVYSLHEDSEALFKSTPGGASGYLLRRTPPGHLLAPIEALLPHAQPSVAAISEHVRKYFRSITLTLEAGQHPHELSRLTRREREIMDCLGKGYVDKEIAGALGISTWTVHGHIKNIFEKLGVHSRIEAVLKYLHK